MSDDVARAFAAMRRTEFRGTREEPFRFGTAALTPELPLRHDSNFLYADRLDGDVSAAELAAEADRILGGAGYAHRVITCPGDEAARLADGFRELGWAADRHLVMVLRRPPERDGRHRARRGGGRGDAAPVPHGLHAHATRGARPSSPSSWRLEAHDRRRRALLRRARGRRAGRGHRPLPERRRRPGGRRGDTRDPPRPRPRHRGRACARSRRRTRREPSSRSSSPTPRTGRSTSTGSSGSRRQGCTGSSCRV